MRVSLDYQLAHAIATDQVERARRKANRSGPWSEEDLQLACECFEALWPTDKLPLGPARAANDERIKG